MNALSLSLLRLWKWSWRPGWVIITGLVVAAAGVAMYVSSSGFPGRTIAIAGGFVMFLGAVMAAVRHVVPLADTGFAALVMADLTLTAFLAGFPVLTLVLATAGAPGSALAALFANRDQSGVPTLVGNACLLVIAVAVLCPQWLRRRGRCMGAVRNELARTLLPSWLAAAAALATWAYVFMLRFGAGPLTGARFSTLGVATGAAFVALLLVPLYQFTARSCWEHGLEHVLDPLRWRDAVAEVLDALRSPGEAGTAGEAAETQEQKDGEREAPGAVSRTCVW